MLAPVLARLSSLAGVRSAQVDASGRYFLLEAPATCVPEALERLGPGAYAVPEPRAQAQVQSWREGELWVTAVTAIQLSWVELRLLANRWGLAAAAAAGMEGVEADCLVELLRAAMGLEFRRVHAAGGTADAAWYLAAFPAAWRRATAALPPERAAAVLAELQRQMTG